MMSRVYAMIATVITAFVLLIVVSTDSIPPILFPLFVSTGAARLSRDVPHAYAEIKQAVCKIE